ncbi:SDR family NAD(P)-dependent oxidoreductase [Stackebrandtia nassauensis]|uniref:Short-chain dehydrogenase/reductase SDR n=1 Tax=Stackebrandtia nassauensis (strain DSM 44728 / CIP 108903 / NRRL B-16338 / NBRC 102104 / LLR-40K-21) TaxID=446470 RepID=D3Q9S2_STANL|nr:SDR family oxidoreductase [Stackebrandtia nassauensis]ADD44618.1 short-chain dehydrogenase/reductase SDR [Stackebrandtia nassauensis DSM 44728]
MSRIVIVTGGGTGIGRAVAARFAEAGDSVVITGRRQAVLDKTVADLGGDIRAITCDHTDPEQLAALAAALPERVDVLVNNAGGNTDIGTETPSGLAGLGRAWLANLDTNLISAALTTEAIGERLGSGGSVIHIGSIAADKGNGFYGAAKAGLASWNIGLARELGTRDITSNVISPGYISETEFFGDVMTEQRRAALIEATFVKRVGIPADIAGAAWFLASPDARYVTGQTLNVNGGAWSSR